VIVSYFLKGVEGGGQVKTVTEGEGVQGTHKLESAEEGVVQDSKRKCTSERITS
jgi:hypothetical protein